MKKGLLIALFLCCLQGLTACNTLRGLGEDIQAGGEAVSSMFGG